MDDIDERLIMEVQKFPQLYDSSEKHYKDSQITSNSWKEIAQEMNLNPAECMRRWKCLRDKYVRHRKRMLAKSEDERSKGLPAFYHYLSWLAPHIKHRVADSNEDQQDRNKSKSEPVDDSLDLFSNSEEFLVLQSASQSTQSLASPIMAKKRKRPDKDEWFLKQVAQLEERRADLHQRLVKENDSSSRFGQIVADMLRGLPEKTRSQVMFDIHKLLYEAQAQQQNTN